MLSKTEALSKVSISLSSSFLEGVVYDGGVNFYHKDASTARLSKNKKSVFFHPNWEQAKRYPEKLQKIPIYPQIAGSSFIIHYKDYESTFTFYGLPDYVAALEHIAVDYEIGKWNHTKFKNGFQPSAIVEINGDMGEKEAKELLEKIGIPGGLIDVEAVGGKNQPRPIAGNSNRLYVTITFT